MLEPINKERLETYYRNAEYLQKLYERRDALREKVSTLSGIDYSKQKVMQGNGQKMSPQEHFASVLLDINLEITNLEAVQQKEFSTISSQLVRIKNLDYRKIIRRRYLEHQSWKHINYEFNCSKPDFEQYCETKYHLYTMYWHKRALEEFEKVTQNVFIPRDDIQTTLEI